MSEELQSALLETLRKNEAISARFRSYNEETSHVFSDNDSAPILEFINQREQFVQALAQLSEQVKELEGQLSDLPPAVTDEIAGLHASIDTNIRAILSLDKRSMTVVQDSMWDYRTKTGLARSKKKQISSYLRSEVAGLNAHKYDKTK